MGLEVRVDDDEAMARENDVVALGHEWRVVHAVYQCLLAVSPLSLLW